MSCTFRSLYISLHRLKKSHSFCFYIQFRDTHWEEKLCECISSYHLDSIYVHGFIYTYSHTESFKPIYFLCLFHISKLYRSFFYSRIVYQATSILIPFIRHRHHHIKYWTVWWVASTLRTKRRKLLILPLLLHKAIDSI